MRAWCPVCKDHVDLIPEKGDLEPKCSICKNRIPAGNQKWDPRYVDTR